MAYPVQVGGLPCTVLIPTIALTHAMPLPACLRIGALLGPDPGATLNANPYTQSMKEIGTAVRSLRHSGV